MTRNIPERELEKYYSPELIKRFQTEGRIESFFWQKDAVLPVSTKEGEQLLIWGNKDANVRLPKTGWAREESLREGKWDYLQPEIVDLLLNQGYEKKVGFDLPDGAKGLLVRRGEESRVYMMTKEASAEYRKLTGHDREPLGEKRNYQSRASKAA